MTVAYQRNARLLPTPSFNPTKRSDPARREPLRVWANEISNQAVGNKAIAPRKRGLEFKFTNIPAQPPDPVALKDVRSDARDGGRRLPRGEQTFFQTPFRHDSRHKRIHADGAVARWASTLDARAFTVGRGLVLSEGQFSSLTNQGRHLPAHGLTRAIQQTDTSSDQSHVAVTREAPTMVNRALRESPRPATTGGSASSRPARGPLPMPPQQQSPCVTGTVHFPLSATGIGSGHTCLRPGAYVYLVNLDTVPHDVLVTPPNILNPYGIVSIPVGGAPVRFTTPRTLPPQIKGGSIIDRPGPGQTVHDISVIP